MVLASLDSISYSIAAFICALFVLEYGADNFIDHTAILAKRTAVPEALIALLTAGAEWEELAVVIFSLAQGRQSLALGNVVGSSISNILGAFSLGLLFSSTTEDGLLFDSSSARYTVIQLGVTVIAALLLAFQDSLHVQAAGICLIVLFGAYVASIFWAIRKGMVTGPELSDSDSDSDSDAEQDTDTPSDIVGAYGTFAAQSDPREPRSSMHPEDQSSISLSDPSSDRSHQRSLFYHLLHLSIGFLCLVVSAYVLSRAATDLIDLLGLSDAVFGIVVLSIATTLPEKLIAVVSGSRGQSGIMVANTVGSNIFLLTLCLGVIWISPENGRNHERPSVHALELATLVASSMVMCVAVFALGKAAKALGLGMLLAYIAFLILEVFALQRE
jgi:Ca2+/Na+ antiporter